MKLNKSMLLTLVTALCISTFSQESKKPAVGDLGWMSGCWQQDRGPGRYFKEQWTKPMGMMVGMAHTVRDGKMTSYEFLRIIEKEGSIYYVAIPSGQKETYFKMTSMTDSEVVFENPEHDFPQKITYKKTENSITARAEAVQDGRARGFDTVFKPVSCDP